MPAVAPVLSILDFEEEVMATFVPALAVGVEVEGEVVAEDDVAAVESFGFGGGEVSLRSRRLLTINF